MSDNTKIEWTDLTWNPTRGCSRVSPGCQNCYAERVARRFSGTGQPYDGLLHKSGAWNGRIGLVADALGIPWRKSKGCRIFVDSMSDLFHPEVPFEFIAAVFFVMSVTTRHTYQLLTKRPERALDFFRWAMRHGEDDDPSDLLWELGHDHAGWLIGNAISDIGGDHPAVKALGWEPWREGGGRGGYDNCGPGFPYSNVHIGVSVEDQARADERIPLLLQIPASVRWLSCEPLLEHVDLSRACSLHRWTDPDGVECCALPRHLDWVVVGGESGRSARPMHPDWARSLRDQCAAAGVPFFFKQWGEWAPHYCVAGGDEGGDLRRGHVRYLTGDGREPDGHFRRGDAAVARIGKKAAGRLLDGVEHNAYPEHSNA